MSDGIDITGLDHAEVLVELYNGTKAFGLGVDDDLPDGLSPEMARECLAEEIAAGKQNGRGDRVQLDYVTVDP